MILDHAAIVALVPKVNGTIAAVSVPFALYEALSKKADTADLKERIELRADQLYALTVTYLEETLMPFWPRTISRIIIEPQVQIETTAALSEDARNALTDCLRKHGLEFTKANKLRLFPKKIHRFNRILYWLIFLTASLSLLLLVFWFLSSDMSDRAAKTAILGPGVLLLASLGVAGARQSYIQVAESGIIE
jgi:hypothetical protein